jgi:hypothetical protein
MAATEISDEVLTNQVTQGIEKWRRGELFMTIGVGEEDPILEPGATVPDPSKKDHHFNKFLNSVASVIAQEFFLGRGERKSILQKLNSNADKWKELIVANAPSPKKTKVKKDPPPIMNDALLESTKSPEKQQIEVAEPTTNPADAKERMDTRLDEKRRNFEEARDTIMADVPDLVKERFGKIFFSKWGKNHLPCLAMNPYSVPPGGVRDMWLDMYDKVRGESRYRRAI